MLPTQGPRRSGNGAATAWLLISFGYRGIAGGLGVSPIETTYPAHWRNRDSVHQVEAPFLFLERDRPGPEQPAA